MAKQKSSGWLDKYQEGGWTVSPKVAAYNKAGKQTPTDIDANAMQALEQVTSYPQRKITEWISGKNQYPSQALGIQNPYGAFAVDAVADPVNLVGAGLLGKAAKASGKLSKASKIAKAASKGEDAIKLTRAAVPNPLALLDQFTPRLDPIKAMGVEMDIMDLSPLNLIPGYGKKLSGKNQTFRKFGNSLDDVIQRQALSPAGGSDVFRIGKDQIVSEGNWAARNQPSENYPGVFEATFDMNNPNANLSALQIPDRNGVLMVDRLGRRLPEIPLTEPGMSFNRRLPFSTRYVPIDKTKLMNNQFQLATQLPHLQSLVEKYGLAVGGAGAYGYFRGGEEGAKEKIDFINQYTVDPVLDVFKGGIDKATELLPKKKNGGWLDKFQPGGFLDKISSTLNPFNWGVEDYSDKGNFNTAFAQAKKAGEKEFMYNNKRFNTRKDTDPIPYIGNHPNQKEFDNFLRHRSPEFFKTLNRGKNVGAISFEGHEDQPNRGFIEPNKTNSKIAVGKNPEDVTDFMGTVIAEAGHLKDPKLYESIFNPYSWKSKLEESIYGDKKRYNIPGTVEYDDHRLIEPGMAMIAYGNLSPSNIKRIQKSLDVTEDGYFGPNTYKALQNKYSSNEDVKNALKDHQLYSHDKDENPIHMGLYPDLVKSYLNALSQDVPLKNAEMFKRWNVAGTRYTDEALRNTSIEDMNPRLLQEALIKRGYKLPKSTRKSGYLDEKIGDETTKALQDFQTKTTPVSKPSASFSSKVVKKENGGWLDKYNDGGPVQPNYNDASVSMSKDFVGDGYSNVGRNYSPAWGGQFKDGGNLSFISDPKLRNMLEGYKPGFLETAGDYRLPEGYMAGSIYPSTEVSTSIGGEDGEPAYLIPSFKYGQPLQDPVQEFDMTGQYLGGPFKTWQDAEKFQELRHQYVEKGQPLPSPIATSNMAMGGSMPGAVGFTYARTIGPPAPSNGKYAKKTKASAQNGTEMRYYQEGLDFKPKTISKDGGWLSKYEEGGVIQDDMGQWAHPGEITEIGSNQITMQGVPYPVLGISDTGDTQMMYPNEEYQYDGSSVTEYPMMAAGGEVEDPKKKSIINLSDLTMTPAELEYINASNSGYCPGGNCLENTRKGYDMTAGRIPGIPSSGDIWTKDLQLISTKGTPGEKLVKENPYFAGDTSFGSADSWDIHGAIVKAGGKNIYSQAKGQTMPKDIAIGSMIGWGPAGTRASSYSNRQKGFNTKYGLQPSHHSTQVVSYNEQGESIVYDSYLGKYGPLSEIAKDLKSSLGYELENISVPKSVAGNTRENLAKKGLLKNDLTDYSPDINKLIGATDQSWAQIKEDGKVRSPKVDQDALNEFARALSKNKGELVSSLRITNADYDRLANTALALAMTESEGGGALGFSDRFGNTQGMTQLNVDNIKKDARLKSALDKNYKSKVSVTNLLSPASSAIATMMYLSVADKDAKRLYNKGLKPGVRTFNQPGLIENFRSTNSRLNKDGIFIDELNKRIPYSEIPGYDKEDVTQVNNYLKKLTKSDKYSFVNKDGDLSLKMKTKGNNPKLTDVEKIAYMWQSPNSLKTGDAEGKSEYVNKIKNYYNLLNLKKMAQGGQLTKLDQLTNFTNYNTKQPGSWLDKYQ
jgi:hypothetical protein